MNEREAVLNALIKQEQNGYSTIILNNVLNNINTQNGKNSNSVSFITTLFYGVIERKITLDYIIEKFLNKPLKKLPVLVLNVLRMAVFEGLYLNTPHFAVVNEAVNLVKKSKYKYLSGMVNAVVKKAVLYDLKYLNNKPESIKFSCNEDIFNTVKDYIGKEEAEHFFINSFNKAPVFVSVNTLKTTKEELLKTSDIFLDTDVENVLELKSFNSKEKLFLNGYYFVQDISAAMCVHLANPKKNERIFDVCAAPGGKSFLTSLICKNKAEILSADIYVKRTELIKKTAEKLGLNIKTLVNNGEIYNKDLGKFDLVLCDVPCSGLGTVRRKPEIKYKTLNEIEGLYKIQRNILKVSSEYVKEGGRILYSTCTLNKKENNEVIEEFLSENKNFYLKEQKVFYNKINGGDGFFAALIYKK